MRLIVRTLCTAALAVIAAPLPLLAQAPLGNAFSYQGQLKMNAAPYTGSADFVFRLYDAAAGGTQVGGDVGLNGVAVAGGLFTVALDFGAVFDGNERWLECDVMTPGDAGFTTLAPRQLLAAAPYALRALNGPTGTSQWTNSAAGIQHPGNVAIGATASPSSRLWVNGGTANVNPLVVTNNNTSWGALAVRNDAPGGYGIYDAWSDKHYLDGFLGLGVSSPTHPIDVTTIPYGASAIKATAVGAHFPTEYQAAVIAQGYAGTPGLTTPAMGVYASSELSRAVWGTSVADLAVVGDCQNSGTSGWLGGVNEGVYGQATTSNRVGGYFKNTAGGTALVADGLAKVKTLQILGADLAESFPLEGKGAEPGTVLAIADGRDGALRVCDEAYSRRVAGVVSGANGLDAGVILKGAAYDADGHAAVALSGRVWVKCDATMGAIRAGDLLTSAARAGYAMRVGDSSHATGAILGKAMSSLETGTGLVLVLVSLQ